MSHDRDSRSEIPASPYHIAGSLDQDFTPQIVVLSLPKYLQSCRRSQPHSEAPENTVIDSGVSERLC